MSLAERRREMSPATIPQWLRGSSEYERSPRRRRVIADGGCTVLR